MMIVILKEIIAFLSCQDAETKDNLNKKTKDSADLPKLKRRSSLLMKTILHV